MATDPPDKIHIRDLRISCIIGIFPEERVNKQDVLVNITLYADLRKACAHDDIIDTIDYKKLKHRVLDLVEASDFFLVERLAESIAAVCLEDARVLRCNVSVDKPGALSRARSVAIEIERSRS